MSAAREAASPLSLPIAALCGVLAVLGWVFAEEAAAAVTTWDRSSAYNHCWLVLPVAGFLAWTRRHRLAGLRPAPSALLALPALGLALAWLVAERLGIMEGRQLAAIGLVQVAVLALLGWRIGRAMAAPLAYLVFLVPFGAFLVPVLQEATAAIILAGLRIASVPHYVDGLVIQTPAGTFLVAEACAGLRFIVASLAFGAFYAAMLFRTAGRRLVVLALAILVPVLANGLRALGIVLLGQWLGSAEAAAADHLVYGWGFFTVVLLLLIAAGLPFRQDGDQAAAPPAPATRRAAPAMLVVALLLAPVALALAGRQGMERAGPGGVTEVAGVLAPMPGCAPERGGSLVCGDRPVAARLVVLPARTGWSAVVAAQDAATRPEDEDATFTEASGGATWRVRHGSGAAPMIAIAIWLDGAPAGGGLRSRAAQAWNGLRGGGPPVLVVVTLGPAPGPRDAAADQQARRLMRRLIEAQTPGLGLQAAALSTGR